MGARGVHWAELIARAWTTSSSPAPWSGRRRRAGATRSRSTPSLEKLGRTSLTVRFVIRVGERVCCVVRTTYVCIAEGTPAPWPDDVRALLTDG